MFKHQNRSSPMQPTALHKFYSLKMQRSIESNRKLPKNKTLLKVGEKR